MHFVPSRDGLNVPSFDAEYFLLPSITFLRSLGFHIFSGGGGSCRRQGKSAAPAGARGVRLWLVCYVVLLLRSAMTK